MGTLVWEGGEIDASKTLEANSIHLPGPSATKKGVRVELYFAIEWKELGKERQEHAAQKKRDKEAWDADLKQQLQSKALPGAFSCRLPPDALPGETVKAYVIRKKKASDNAKRAPAINIVIEITGWTNDGARCALQQRDWNVEALIDEYLRATG